MRQHPNLIIWIIAYHAFMLVNPVFSPLPLHQGLGLTVVFYALAIACAVVHRIQFPANHELLMRDYAPVGRIVLMIILWLVRVNAAPLAEALSLDANQVVLTSILLIQLILCVEGCLAIARFFHFLGR